MIRTTHLGMNELVKLNLAKVSNTLQAKQEQAVTGQRINRPSDDPGALSEVHRLYHTIEDLGVYKQNSDFSSGILNEMDNALSGVQDIIIRAKEIATQMSNGNYTATDRANAAPEVQELYNSLVTLANTNTHGRYVFAGDAYQSPAFTAAGVYQGLNTTPSARIADNQWAQTGYDGSQVFQSNVDIFAAMNGLLTALQTNTVANVQAAMTSMDTATDQISTWRASIGAEVNASDDAAATGEAMSTQFSNRLNSLLNIDQSAVYLDVNDLRNSYESTLRVSATSNQTSLFELL
jgi:flagellar hook-associated protein 3 FlgL